MYVDQIFYYMVQFATHLFRKLDDLEAAAQIFSEFTQAALVWRDPLRNYFNARYTGGELMCAVYDIIQVGAQRGQLDYKVTKNFKNYFSEIECKILTGRTHQIRVHMQSINCPLIGDQLYSRNRNISESFSNNIKRFLKEFRRQALHAQQLSFLHPKSKIMKSFFTEMPNDMLSLKDQLVAEFNLNS